MTKTIKHLRSSTGMSQKKFGDFLDIPLKTIQNWEYERTKCPEYVVGLIEYKLEKEKKITNNKKTDA